MPSLWFRRNKVKGPKKPPPVPERIPPRPPAPGGLRIAFLVYRGNPRCGGQGVYTRHLTRELVALGHSVEVFAGRPAEVGLEVRRRRIDRGDRSG